MKSGFSLFDCVSFRGKIVVQHNYYILGQNNTDVPLGREGRVGMMATDNIMKNQLTISLLSRLVRQTPNA